MMIFDDERSDDFFFSRTFVQGEEPLDTGGGRVFSLDASFGLILATATASASASASALALFRSALRSAFEV